jgi:hypothetical protein
MINGAQEHLSEYVNYQLASLLGLGDVTGG